MKNKIIYIVSISLFIVMMSSSIKGLYQIYFIDLINNYNINYTELSLLGSFFGIFVGFFSPITGYLCDKFNHLMVILSGVIVAIIAFAILSFSNSIYTLFISFGILLSYSLTAMTFIPFSLLVDSIFSNNKKQIFFAVLSNGTSIGFIILSPILIYLNSFLSWQNSNEIFFFLYLFLVFPLTIVLKKLVPNQIRIKKSSNNFDKNIFTHLKSLKFVILALSFGGCGASMGFIDVHYIPLIKQDAIVNSSNILSALCLSLLGISEIIGSILIVIIIRFVNIYFSLAILYLIRVGLFVLLTFFNNNEIIYLLFSIIFGLTYMGTVIISSILCLEIFNLKCKGTIFGYLFFVHQIFVFLSVFIGGFNYDLFSNYNGYLSFLILISSISVFGSFFLHSIISKYK